MSAAPPRRDSGPPRRGPEAPAPPERTRTEPPAGPQPERYDDIWQFIQPGQPITPELLEQIAQDIMGKELELKARDMDYKDNFLDYLEGQLGLNQDQLALAETQMEFQQGPYWDWYTTDYFDYVKQDSENKARISDNQVSQSGNVALSSYYQTKSHEAQLAGQMAQQGNAGIRYAPQARVGY